MLARADLSTALRPPPITWPSISYVRWAPDTEIRQDQRVVDNGRIVCSAGIAAGIDMSLHVVGRLLGKEAALQTATQMEYPWSGSIGEVS